MALNHHQGKLSSSSDNDEPDLFASWEPVVNVYDENEGKSSKTETRQQTVSCELAPAPTNVIKQYPENKHQHPQRKDRKQCKHEETWLDPCRFSGKVVRQSEINNVHVMTYVVPGESINKSGDNSSHAILTRKVTVLPPSAGYRGFCNVNDLSDSQRQPWKRIKGETKSPEKGNMVKEFIANDGKKVKMMRLPDEDPPKKIKKLQIENTSVVNFKDELSDFELLKRIEIPARKKISSLQVFNEGVDKVSKEVSEPEAIGITSPKTKSNVTGDSDNEHCPIQPGRIIKQHYGSANKNSNKRVFSLKPEHESVDSVKTKKNSIIALPVKHNKQPQFIRKRDKLTNSAMEENIDKLKGKGDNADKETEDSQDILSDLESVKAKLAKLSEEIGEGDNEPVKINGGDKELDSIKTLSHRSSVSPSKKIQSSLKNQVSSIALKKPDQFDDNKEKENSDNTRKKNNEKNEADRKAAKEYMRMKKAQWKEQQMQELDKKRMALEARQLKLKQLQQTQLKLLKQSIKKKSSTVEAEAMLENLVSLVKC